MRMGFRSFVIPVANDLKLNQMELVQLPGKQVRVPHGRCPPPTRQVIIFQSIATASAFSIKLLRQSTATSRLVLNPPISPMADHPSNIIVASF